MNAFEDALIIIGTSVLRKESFSRWRSWPHSSVDLTPTVAGDDQRAILLEQER